MIEINALKKRFGPREVLRGLDARIESGRVTAIVGPNGAGKTTLIKCLLGLTRPDAGSIEIDGRRLNGDWTYRSKIGYMPQAARFPENLTAREVIRMHKDLRGNPDALDEGLLHAFSFTDDLDKPIRTLSGGTRQKVSAVIAFLFRPSILILDEPTAGLDPIASSRLKDKIIEAKEAGKTVILTSHIMSEIEELSDHIIFLLEGKICFEGPRDEIKAVTGEERLERAIAALLEHRGAPGAPGADGRHQAIAAPLSPNGHAAVAPR
jgi:Cu-processing system ATP-binding protein